MFLCHISYDTLPSDIHAFGEHRSLRQDNVRLDRRPQQIELHRKSIGQFWDIISFARPDE